ncbi:MAG: hypothetical protein IPK97_15820 [Ahniella sp.]|nr:hypothetical protein [Ahniella sp.]
MSLSAFHCPPPIRYRRPLIARDYARRDLAIELFDRGEYVQAITETFAHAMPEVVARTPFVLPMSFAQGSSRFDVRLDGDELVLTTVLAELNPGANATALLRFALSRMAGTGQIYQPRLKDQVVRIEFREQLRHLHPLKLLEVLMKLPAEASGQDQWLAEEFQVARPASAALTPLTEAEAQAAVAFWHRHWSDMEILHNEVRRRRSVRMLDFAGSLASNLTRLVLPLNGSVRIELDEFADEIADREESVSKRDAAMARLVRAMQGVDDTRLLASLGHGEYAINPLREGSPSMIHSLYGPGERMQAVHDHRANGRLLEAGLELLSYGTYLLATCSWAEPVEQAIAALLASAHEKPIREVLDSLLVSAESIAEEYGKHGVSASAEADTPAETMP